MFKGPYDHRQTGKREDVADGYSLKRRRRGVGHPHCSFAAAAVEVVGAVVAAIGYSDAAICLTDWAFLLQHRNAITRTRLTVGGTLRAPAQNKR